VSARGGGGVIALLLIAIVVMLADSSGVEPEPETPRSPNAGSGTRAEVLRVIDGDTIEVNLAGEVEDVRYIGVDTPETVKPGAPVECYGPQASAFNKKLVEGRDVVLRFDAERRDIYGRLLAYVYVGKRFVNGALVRGGYAQTLEIEPNTSQADLLERLQLAASRAGLGLWGRC
jgi:micrococcal nuclease